MPSPRKVARPLPCLPESGSKKVLAVEEHLAALRLHGPLPAAIVNRVHHPAAAGLFIRAQPNPSPARNALRVLGNSSGAQGAYLGRHFFFCRVAVRSWSFGSHLFSFDAPEKSLDYRLACHVDPFRIGNVIRKINVKRPYHRQGQPSPLLTGEKSSATRK